MDRDVAAAGNDGGDGRRDEDGGHLANGSVALADDVDFVVIADGEANVGAAKAVRYAIRIKPSGDGGAAG